MRSLSPLEWRV
jgi:hypothetical protein